jgi:hypothetical protein
MLRPLRSIDAHEQLTVAWVDPTLPYLIRRRELAAEQFFDCKCKKCVSDKEEADQEGAVALEDLLPAYKQSLHLISSASADATLTGPIQKLRYAAHLLWEAGFGTTEAPFPQIVQKLVRAYLENHQINIAMAYAAIIQFEIDDSIYENMADHPAPLMHSYQFVQIMSAVMEAEDWACQKLDLVSRELEIEFMARYVVRHAAGLCKDVYGGRTTRAIELLNITLRPQYNKSDAAILDKVENRDKAFEPLYELTDEVLGNLQTGKGEVVG